MISMRSVKRKNENPELPEHLVQLLVLSPGVIKVLVLTVIFGTSFT